MKNFNVMKKILYFRQTSAARMLKVSKAIFNSFCYIFDAFHVNRVKIINDD